jgi:hypothetical protein
MKKVVLLFGFAMCASIVFVHTENSLMVDGKEMDTKCMILTK